MYLLALILSYCALATATSPPIIPVVQKAPTPQWGDMSPGLYRFVNVATRTALSVSDSGADSLVVSMPVADNDNAQRWHVMDPTDGFGLWIVNNGTGKFLMGIK
ncbi:MAG: hypothetical protein L6R36_008970, partial [Xanthoria steineri]